MIYKHLETRHNEDIQVHLSYMEIYQEVGYDLLNAAARNNSSMVTPLAKVSLTTSGYVAPGRYSLMTTTSI